MPSCKQAYILRRVLGRSRGSSRAVDVQTTTSNDCNGVTGVDSLVLQIWPETQQSWRRLRMEFPNNQARRKAVWGRQCRLPVAVALLTLLACELRAGPDAGHAGVGSQRRPAHLGYMVSAGLSSGNYIAQFNVGTQNRLQLDLPHGGAYYAVVRAYDGARQVRSGVARDGDRSHRSASGSDGAQSRAPRRNIRRSSGTLRPVAGARSRIWYRSAPRRARSTSSTAIRSGWFTPQAACCRRGCTSPASRR